MDPPLQSPLDNPASSTTTTSSTQSAPLQNTFATTSASSRVSSATNPNKRPFQNLGLHSGAASGNLGLVKFALDNGQPIDSVVNGVLPIHAACCSNANVAVVLFLIEHGSDVNARRQPRKYGGERAVGSQAVGTTGSTPLHFAAANGCQTVVEILLRHGAIADLADKYGTTPYIVAVARNHPDIANLLHQHASMQRGLQEFTPDSDTGDGRDKDSFISPRNSGDFSRRVSAIMAPTRPCTIQTESSQLLSSPPHIITTTISAAARNLNQRRVSLPSIMESPSPTASSAPRQSCDLGRPPLSREPFDTASEPIIQTTSTNSPSSHSWGFSLRDKPRSSQNFASGLLTGRRKSVDISAMGSVSPPAAHKIHRRASFDQISVEKLVDSKSRRDSDASISETVVSGPSSCSTLASPMMLGSNGSESLLDESEEMRVMSSAESSSMERSLSQPPLPLEGGVIRRLPESNARKSFDLRLFASPRQQVAVNDDAKPQIWSYRRRSIQEPFLSNDNGEKTNYSSQEISPQGNGRDNSKHRTSFSGNATISGRLSRLWTNGPGRDIQENIVHRKGGSAGSVGLFVTEDGEDGVWSPNDLAKDSIDRVELSPVSKEMGADKPRVGVLSRFSGIWSRR
ncbi:hypothetical protein BGX21_001045 [Mortierella sp. AD011]|nr:hypothetical protein BGX20_009653 [Mortierella sp. AD010]KAF9403672.1 hypothetical protein BGX21_001045 [Mortierella sp. AD011]